MGVNGRETYVTERGTHDDGLVAMLLVIVEDLLDRYDTRILLALVRRSGLVLLVPVKNLGIVAQLPVV